jgi:hypothetical protein
MTERILGAVTRRTHDAVSRRGSLLTLGTAALIVAAAQPALGDVAKASKKTSKLKKKKCKRQVDQCIAGLIAGCQGSVVCESNTTCCGLFANCNATDALTCIFAA